MILPSAEWNARVISKEEATIENKPKEPASGSHPKDMSLEAYKEWIQGLSNRFTSNQGNLRLTEKEWSESWRKYWNKQSNRST